VARPDGRTEDWLERAGVLELGPGAGRIGAARRLEADVLPGAGRLAGAEVPGAGRLAGADLPGAGRWPGVGVLLTEGPAGWGRSATGRGRRVRTAMAMAAHNAVTNPPVAAPMAKARRSPRYSLCRRSRSCGGSEARRAAQLL
jgi:hypothetical protein